jgi:carboxyl-terminal processing protease
VNLTRKQINNKLSDSMKKFALLVLLLISVDVLFIHSSNNIFDRNSSVIADSTSGVLPEAIHSGEGQLVTTLLSRYHYKKFSLNDSLSSVIFDRIIKTLDNGKNYLLAEDIEQLEKYRNSLDEEFRSGNLDQSFEIFNLFKKRFFERMDYTDELLKKEFDFTLDEEYQVNREDADWPKSTEEANELWRKRIKNDALTLKLTDKEWDSISETLKKRYDTFRNNIQKYNSEDVFQLVMNSYTESVDPHTNYMSPVTSENFKISMSQSLEGIGAQLQSEEDYTKIVEVIPGGPAFKSNQIQQNDKIIAVAQEDNGEWVDIIGWRVTEVVQLIRGPKGSTVRLQILKAKDGPNAVPKVVRLVRDKIKLEEQSAKAEMLEIQSNEKNYRIGVIKLPVFYSDFEAQQRGDKEYKSTTRDVRRIIDSLKQVNVDGIVMDLRNNGGGSLTEAINLTGLFIEGGPVVQVRNADGMIETGDDPDPSILYRGPLAVLVNRWSASASEIFAAAIQDYGRGIVVGEQTFGKGTVQNLIDINRLMQSRDNKYGQLKLTIAKYYRVNGGSTQHLGVIPDIKFPSYFDDPQKYGESSQPSALPWDQIEPTDYKVYTDFSRFLPELKDKHKERIDKSKEFGNLTEDILKFKEESRKKTVSLNEAVRRKQKAADDEKKFDRESVRNQTQEVDIIDEPESSAATEKESDFLLKESGYILADLISMKLG